MRILLVEDHPDMRNIMTAHLRGRGFVVDACACGTAGLAAATRTSYDAVILDLGLPDMDGMSVLSRLRADVLRFVPVLVLTARDALDDRVAGLDAGADDYLLKPFDLQEFDARLRAVMRRHAAPAPDLLRCGDLALDCRARDVHVGDHRLDLTRREIDLLEALMRAGGRTIVRDALEEQLYGLDEAVTANALEAAVSRLRRRLATAGTGVLLETVRGIGYRLSHQPARPGLS